MTIRADTAEVRETPLRPLPATGERLPAMQRLVARTALFERLSTAGPGQVVLLCAPAGSGKTILLRSWSESPAAPDRVAWVSVERGEEDAQHFWLSVIDALAGAVGEEGLVERVGATPAFHPEGVVEPLLSGLDELDEPVVLVIDDLHELRSPEALRWLEHALARVPPKVQVVLSTRVDPGLGLHRLRLTGDLLEIRSGDLRFSLEETGRLLQAAGIALADAAVARLHERTEGWAAGLRLAAISLAAHPDRERFVVEFSGSERTVAAYLLAEVLERQPARGSRPPAADVDPGPRERAAGRLPDRRLGLRGDPAATRGRERVRVLARRGPNVVPLPPSVRRPAPARAAAARSVDDRAASPRRRRVVRAARGHGGGDPPCAGGGRLADRGAHGGRQLRQPGLRRPAGDAPSAAPGLPGGRRRHGPGAGARLREGAALRRTARGERALHRGGGAPGRHGPATSAGSASSSSSRRRGSRSRAAAAIWPPSRRRCARSRPRWPRSRRAPGGSATTSGPPRS